MIDLDELERLAQEATPGPWEMGKSSIMCRSCLHLRGCYNIYQEADCTDVTHPQAGLDQQDAAYIAAANPQTVLALIKRLREADAKASKLLFCSMSGHSWDSGAQPYCLVCGTDQATARTDTGPGEGD